MPVLWEVGIDDERYSGVRRRKSKNEWKADRTKDSDYQTHPCIFRAYSLAKRILANLLGPYEVPSSYQGGRFSSSAPTTFQVSGRMPSGW